MTEDGRPCLEKWENWEMGKWELFYYFAISRFNLDSENLRNGTTN
jgi:hypothetical protein